MFAIGSLEHCRVYDFTEEFKSVFSILLGIIKLLSNSDKYLIKIFRQSDHLKCDWITLVIKKSTHLK